ncbi:apolipoprotein N-acyltransferase [Gryllotalpicola reticulitermitis]|uniref:Apolipoprotein N-acyltransferase n=1 Tax=Gryllotalpicola reticulitermitis TaxID=1184153 RepID=A0ABV8Q9U5_9MICO
MLRKLEPRRRAAAGERRRPPHPLFTARTGHGLPLWAALICSAAGGVVFDGAFPALSWWPLVFPGVALLLYAQQGRRAWSALLVGFVGGLAFFLTDVAWTGLYLGPAPWLALSATEGALWAVGALLYTLAYRFVPRAIPGRLGRLVVLPIVLAGLWTLRELVTDHWPFTGFAWGRVAYTQSASPFTHLVAYVGVAGLSFLLVWVTAFAIAFAQEGGLTWATRALVPIVSALALASVPALPSSAHGTTRVAAVQGNGPAGYFQPHRLGDVEEAQLDATLPLLQKGKFSMVVWPEGSADLDPLANASSAAVLSAFSKALGAPLVVGAITDAGPKTYNSSLLWDGTGKLAQYDKQLPVPFGEYIPDRAFFHLLAPHLVDLVQRGYSPGTRPNVFDINGIKAGISICFDITDDRQIPQMIDGGAQLILAQTNNADFGRTEENVQQLAIARMRAVEADRSVVNISTVGTSQIIGPTGRTITSTAAYKPGTLVAEVPLATGITPAVRLGSGLELGAATLGGAGLIGCFVLLLARRKDRALTDPALTKLNR